METMDMKTPPVRILFVKDNADDETVLMRQLRRAKFDQQIMVIDNEPTAVEYLTGIDSPCEALVAIFLDLDLPAMSGLHLLEKIRSHDRTRHLAVIVMTSSNDPEVMKNYRTLGVSGYVSKPVTLTAFTHAVANTFHASKLRPFTQTLKPDPNDRIERDEKAAYLTGPCPRWVKYPVLLFSFLRRCSSPQIVESGYSYEN